MSPRFIQTILLLLLPPVPGPGAVSLLDNQTQEMIEDPAPSAFSVCFRHGCKDVARVSLSQDEWEYATADLRGPMDGPAREREAIATAIDRLEQIVGRRTGTQNDKGGGLRGILTVSPQMDCIDESTNSTTYLRLMERDGLLKWHRIKAPRTRGYIVFGHPHTTAVIEDTTTGEDFAVDSWFFDNGRPAVVVPLDQWLRGWRPG